MKLIVFFVCVRLSMIWVLSFKYKQKLKQQRDIFALEKKGFSTWSMDDVGGQ